MARYLLEKSKSYNGYDINIKREDTISKTNWKIEDEYNGFRLYIFDNKIFEAIISLKKLEEDYINGRCNVYYGVARTLDDGGQNVAYYNTRNTTGNYIRIWRVDNVIDLLSELAKENCGDCIEDMDIVNLVRYKVYGRL